jgi:hypothetical protein
MTATPKAAAKRPLTKAQRATKREELHQLVLAAALRAQELVADDLGRLARDQAAPELRELTLASHRLQLVLRTVDTAVDL